MTSLDLNAPVLLTIGLAAVVTYSLRFGGLMLAEKLPRSGRWKRFMDALPGAILLSLIAPAIVSAGVWGGIGALATAICAYKTGNTLLSMLLGVLIVALHRQF
jgi:uncharacterized membrane protein